MRDQGTLALKSTLKRRLESEHAYLIRGIASELSALRHKINRAITNLDSGQRLDAHLIANSVMLTEQIARWNLIRDLAQMVDDDDGKEI